MGIDNDYLTWAKNPFEFSEIALESFLKIDTDKKIKVIRGNFHSLSRPIDNDTMERNFLSTHCKPGNWIIQIDADETFLNGNEFIKFMTENEEVVSGCAIKAHWITVFKSFDKNKYLVIDGNCDTDGRIFIGTQISNSYTICRNTDQTAIQSPLKLLHMSWGRTKSELKKKLENWGHSTDFNTNSFLEMWDTVTLDNYGEYKNLHPLNGPDWPKLKRLDLDEIINKHKK